ncbi:TonB-dependent receptor [Litorimonas sp. RW-G-Af-16]|uniref:TonB-dependent receptor n=1 Tax=Litorimonas sp. RW-G-Af-16 TaxID=3241168 RepID=UPI00390CC700
MPKFKKNAFQPLKVALLIGSSLPILAAPTAFAQDVGQDEVIATGIRQSLESALVEKRQADSLVEVIIAEDIGKLPDQNLAEVLENIPGIQITRTEGVGTGVQIRGSDQNLIQFNGVTTVGNGNGRGGINFTDVNPAIIAGLEVVKAPEAYHIEGAVGGIINLRTIRPLDLKDTLASVRIQGEDSSLTSGISPRISGALGKNWENAKGQEIGVVVSASYTKSENTAFRPRLDTDNYVDCTGDTPPSTCPAGADGFLGVQFLNQVQRTQNFETFNIAGSIEAKPTDNLRIFADVVYNDQERKLKGNRIQASNVSRLNGSGDRFNGDQTNFTDFRTVDIGSAPGANGDQDFGSILQVVGGTFQPSQVQAMSEAEDSRGAPFFRVASDAGSRFTDTTTLRFGGEWEATEALTLNAEFARSSSDTVNPNLSINLNFINPNSFIPLTVRDIEDADDNVIGVRLGGSSGTDQRDENGTPLIFDLSNGYGWDINFADPFAPSEADLLDPNNYVIDGNPAYSGDIRENVDQAIRFDASYDLSETRLSNFLTSFDAGVRFGERSSIRDDRSGSVSGSGLLAGSLNAGGISQLLSEIPDNFAEGSGNALAVDGVLQVDPDLTRDFASTITTINSAASAQGLNPIFRSGLTRDDSAFFDITEDTLAIYGQANFDFGRVRGNAGLRYIDTSLSSTANVIIDDVPATGGNPAVPGSTTLTTVENGYDHFLPRVNVAVDVTEDVIFRGAYYEDIRRPDFNDLTSGIVFPDFGGVNGNAESGNPLLVPEEVDSLEASLDWYFAPEAVFSVGVFRKERNGLFGAREDTAVETGNPPVRDVTAPCEGGGIFSPGTSPGIFGDDTLGTGVCVDNESTFNSDNSTTQKGVEVAFQYNLSGWEDKLGWASGFGLLANYTYQNEDNNTGFVGISGNRNKVILAAQGFPNVTRETATLLRLSNHAYNLTGYYEKYGLSARLRYTWRDAFATDDLPGTSGVFTPYGFRGQQEARGQLNGSLSYEVTDGLTVQVDAVNLTESNSDVACVEGGALRCYQGITDRRVIFGASYTF